MGQSSGETTMSNTWCKTFGVLCVLFVFLIGACEPPPPGSCESRITVERITGATLVEIGRDNSIAWHFGVKRFLLEIRGGRRGALVRQLLGRAADVKQIQGQWQFERSTRQLVLTRLRAGSHRQTELVETTIEPVGVLTIELLGSQCRRVKWLRRSAFNPDTTGFEE
jgi:hypothetical protein